MSLKDFFRKIFKKNLKTLDCNTFCIDIPEDYDVLNEKIENGEIKLEELTEKELKIIKNICEKQLENEKKEATKLLEQYKLKRAISAEKR